MNKKPSNFNWQPILVLLFSLFFLTVLFASEEVVDVKVGIYENRPKIFTDKNNNPSGFWTEIIQYVGDEEGWQLEFVQGKWEQCLERLEKAEIDLMPDVAYTENRSKRFVFSSEEVYTSWSGIYIRKDVDIQSVLDIDDKKIAVLKNSVNYVGPKGLKGIVKAFNIDCQFLEKDSYNAVFKAVENGEADAGAASKDFAIQNLSRFNLVNTPIVFQPSSLYFAFPKDSSLTPLLQERIDYHIRELKKDEDSVYYQALNRWFSSDSEGSPIFQWLIWALVISGGVILLLFVGSLLLRAKVQSRTRELTKEINERKRVEKELQNHQKQLEEKVAERTAELKRSNKELELFAYITSHDLQEPLRMVTSYLQLIEKRYRDKLDEDAVVFIDFAVNGAKRMQTLINDLLKYSRVRTKGREFKPVDCEKVMNDTLKNLEISIMESNAEITHTPLPTVTGDKTQLRQLFQNLIGNAIKFRGKDPLRIRVSTEEKKKFWKFFVSDNGIGIDSKYHQRIFRVFQRLHARDDFPGNGIGLAVCRKIVERHGGTIEVESEVNAGTTFIFTIRKEEEENDRRE